MDSEVKDIIVSAEGRGPPLLLLHCLGVDHHFWDFARPLADHFTLYRYDLPGHGIAPVPSPYTVADLSRQLADLIAKHGLGKIHLAGISLGGLVAQHFAATHPDLLDRLILIDTTPRYNDHMRSMWAQRAATARHDGPAALVDELVKIWFSAPAIERNDPAVQYVRRTIGACDKEGYALGCEALGGADLEDLLPAIKASTLVICGDDDIPSFLDAARLLKSRIRGASLSWISQTRHASVLERPDIAIPLMREFLRP